MLCSGGIWSDGKIIVLYISYLGRPVYSYTKLTALRSLKSLHVLCKDYSFT